MVHKSIKLCLAIVCVGLLLLAGCQWPPAFPGIGGANNMETGATTPMSLDNSASADATSEVSQPGPIEQEAPLLESSTATPAVSLPTDAEVSEASTVAPTISSDLAYPQSNSSSSYPEPGSVPTITMYPTDVLGGDVSPYPGSETQAPYPFASPAPNQMPGQVTLIPYPGQSPPPFTPSNTQAPGVATLTPLPTLMLTATPAATASLIPTQTPIPPPPWIQSKLEATDPDEVVLASGKVQLIQFFAFWCGPCQAMAPLVHGLEERYGARMNFIYLDIDDPRTTQLKKQLGYKSQPHFFLLNPSGVVLRQWVGATPIEEISGAIEAALK